MAVQEPPDATAEAAASAVAVASAPEAAALAAALATQLAWGVLEAEAAASAACSTSGPVSLKRCCRTQGLDTSAAGHSTQDSTEQNGRAQQQGAALQAACM